MLAGVSVDYYTYTRLSAETFTACPRARSTRWQALQLYEFRRFCGRAAFARGAAALASLGEQAVAQYEKWQVDGIETTLTRPGLVHAFLDEGAAARTLALQRSVAGGRFAVPEQPLTGSEITSLE